MLHFTGRRPDLATLFPDYKVLMTDIKARLPHITFVDSDDEDDLDEYDKLPLALDAAGSVKYWLNYMKEYGIDDRYVHIWANNKNKGSLGIGGQSLQFRRVTLVTHPIYTSISDVQNSPKY